MIRFKYNPAFADEYCTQLQHSLSINTDVMHLQDMPATNLVEFLHNHICNVANNVFGQKQPPSAHCHCHKPWFDTECRVEKRHVMTFLKDNPKSEFARTLQRNLKQLFKRTKRSYEKLKGMCLCKMAKADPQDFGGDTVRRRKARMALGGRRSDKALLHCWGHLPHHLIRSFPPLPVTWMAAL
jgi:hypothetical protein